MNSATVEVVPYTSEWKLRFEDFKKRLEVSLEGIGVKVEHVGSTSVQGLWAKPKIDIDVEIPVGSFEEVKQRLASLGYYHNGDQGIKGREVFKLPRNLAAQAYRHYRHALYICVAGSREFARHVAFRDYLRAHSAVRDAYSEVKRKAADICNNDIQAYMDAKGEFVTKTLEKALHWAGIAPADTTKSCSSCGQTMTGMFSIKYLGGGYKAEGYAFKCSKCDTDDFVECVDEIIATALESGSNPTVNNA